MAFRETGKNEFYNKLEPNQELKEKMLKNCFESVKYGSPYEEKEFSVRRKDDMKKKKNKVMGFLKTSIAVACAIVATGLVLYGVNKKGNIAANKKTTEGITKEILEYVKDKNPGIYRNYNGEYFIKCEEGILLTKNAYKEKKFKKMQKNCYDDDGKIKEGYIEETFAGKNFAVTHWSKPMIDTDNNTTGVSVIKKDKNGNLSIKPKTYKRQFIIVDGLYFMIGNESEEEGPVVLAPYAYYSYDGDEIIEGWSLYDEGKYYWVTNVEELRDTDSSSYGFGVGIFTSDNVEQFKTKTMISCISNDGEPDFHEGRWLSTYDVCKCVGIDFLEMNSASNVMYKNPDLKEFFIDAGMYVIGDYVLKYDESELLYRNINESEYKKSGMKLKDGCSRYIFCFYDNNLYYDTNWEIRKVDLAANKNIKLYDIPRDKDNYLSIANIFDDRVFINLDGEYQRGTLIYNIKTNKMEENIEEEFITVEDNYVLTQKGNYMIGGNSYTLYKIEDGKIKKEKTFIENGVFLKSIDRKFYYVQFDKKNKTALYRCNLDGSDVEKIAEYKGKEVPWVYDGYYYLNGEKYEF